MSFARSIWPESVRNQTSSSSLSFPSESRCLSDQEVGERIWRVDDACPIARFQLLHSRPQRTGPAARIRSVPFHAIFVAGRQPLRREARSSWGARLFRRGAWFTPALDAFADGREMDKSAFSRSVVSISY